MSFSLSICADIHVCFDLICFLLLSIHSFICFSLFCSFLLKKKKKKSCSNNKGRENDTASASSTVQDAAVNHARAVGFDGQGLGTDECMEDAGIIWVQGRLRIEVDKYTSWDQPLKVTSWFQPLSRWGGSRISCTESESQDSKASGMYAFVCIR